MEILFLVGRILFGGFFVMMGLNHFMKREDMVHYARTKSVSSPEMAVMISGLMIILGGLGVALGIFMDIALWFIIIFLFFVSFMMHKFWAEQDPQQKAAETVNFTKNMALLGAAVMMLSISFWPYSLGAL
ncbi:MAG: DoxX family protein [Candidatus Harrisonbacteria bacterium]|nr:DoxX family protein [Candidatus Harrisonbacteria bacterium]